MQNLRSRSQLCRWVQADLWGEVLNSKTFIASYKAIYNPIVRGPEFCCKNRKKST